MTALSQIASVGLTESAAHAQHLDVRDESSDTAARFTNRRVHELAGIFKTVIDKATDRVLGAPNRSADDVSGMVYYHPELRRFTCDPRERQVVSCTDFCALRGRRA